MQISIGCSEELGIGMKAINYLAGTIPDVFGVEGIGKERLGFDILDKNDSFEQKRLLEISRLRNFYIFTKTKRVDILDLLSEKKENYSAKLKNLLIKLKIS